MPGGASTVVTFDNRLKYAALVEAARLSESDTQLETIQVCSFAYLYCIVSIQFNSINQIDYFVSIGWYRRGGWRCAVGLHVVRSRVCDLRLADRRRRSSTKYTYSFDAVIVIVVKITHNVVQVACAYGGANASGRRYVLASDERTLASGKTFEYRRRRRRGGGGENSLFTRPLGTIVGA